MRGSAGSPQRAAERAAKSLWHDRWSGAVRRQGGTVRPGDGVLTTWFDEHPKERHEAEAAGKWPPK